MYLSSNMKSKMLLVVNIAVILNIEKPSCKWRKLYSSITPIFREKRNCFLLNTVQACSIWDGSKVNTKQQKIPFAEKQFHFDFNTIRFLFGDACLSQIAIKGGLTFGLAQIGTDAKALLPNRCHSKCIEKSAVFVSAVEIGSLIMIIVICKFTPGHLPINETGLPKGM